MTTTMEAKTLVKGGEFLLQDIAPEQVFTPEEFTEEHRMIAQTTEQFVKNEIIPHLEEIEHQNHELLIDLLRKAGTLGLLSAGIPEKYGGLGLDKMSVTLIMEKLAAVSSFSVSHGAHTGIGSEPLIYFGTEEQKKRYLPKLATGQLIAAYALTEPEAGSDALSVKTRADLSPDGRHYVLNGGKMWITNGTQADWACLLANTGDGNVHRNKTLICVPLMENGKRAKGVTVERKLKKMGMHCSDTAELHFEDVRVPVRNRIGEEGEGFTYQMMQFQEERLHAALVTIPANEKTIRETIEYTRQREAFGKTILDNQIVHFRLAELMTEVEALRQLTWNAVEKHVNGEDCTMLASMAKLKATRLSREVNDSCLQYWGGMGYMDETPISRRYRDGRLGSIGGGADEIMLSIICKYMGILPDRRR